MEVLWRLRVYLSFFRRSCKEEENLQLVGNFLSELSLIAFDIKTDDGCHLTLGMHAQRGLP